MVASIVTQAARARGGWLLFEWESSSAYHTETGSRKVLLVVADGAHIFFHGPYSSLGAFPISHWTQDSMHLNSSVQASPVRLSIPV